MIYRRYYDNYSPQMPIAPKVIEEAEIIEPIREETPPPPQHNETSDGLFGGAFGNLKADDIILVALVFLLLKDGCDDIGLLLALGYIFLSDFGGLGGVLPF